VSNRVSRRQAGRWAAQEQEAAPEPAPAPAAAPIPAQSGPPTPAPADMTSKLDQLKQLGELRAQGVLSDYEFEMQKGRILNS